MKQAHMTRSWETFKIVLVTWFVRFIPISKFVIEALHMRTYKTDWI